MTDPAPTLPAPPPAPPPRAAPVRLSLEEGTDTVLAVIDIAGEDFDVLPLSAEVVSFFHRINDVQVETAEQIVTAVDLMRDFIVRCLKPEDEARARAAMARSRASLRGLMEVGGTLIAIASGFPTEPPSLSASPSPSAGGSTTVASQPAEG